MQKLFDAHASLIQRDVLGYASPSLAALAQRSFSIADYAGDIAGRGIAKTVVVSAEADAPLAEARMAAAAVLGAHTDVPGIVAGCNPWKHRPSAILSGWDGLPVIGARLVWTEGCDPGPVDMLFSALAEAGLSCELDLRSPDWAAITRLVETHPHTRVVLSHCGRPDIASNRLDSWRAAITALAVVPNTLCKVAGLFRFCAPHAVDAVALRPCFDFVYAAFGADRLLWGSDWPAVNGPAALQDWIATFRSLVEDLPKGDQAAICYDTAERLYRVTPHAR